MHKYLYTSLLAIIISLCCFQQGYSQNFKISGKILDRDTQDPLVGATVLAINEQDSVDRGVAITNAEGYFIIPKLKKRLYKVTATFMGYEKKEEKIIVSFRDQSVGNILLAPTIKQLQAVTIVGTPPQATLKGDTTEFNASSFKVTADANVEDLVTKMPGVSVEEGTVKAQGEEVKKVLVDGKAFFGDDPSIALKNLPAEIVEKVQVFDQQSEQSQLTGFNDGQTTKTMNIITRKNKRNGQFGKVNAAYGDQDRYSIGGNINKFNGAQRITAIVTSNNINQQNFATQDFLGAMGGTSSFGNRGDGGGNSGGGGGRNSGGGGGGSRGNASGGMGSSMPGSQNGISTVNSIGLNYNNTLNENLTVSGSYFFNNTRNENIQLSQTEYILNDTSSRFDYLNSNSIAKNFNNRLNMRVEWLIDTMNTLILVPSANFQFNNSSSGNIETQSSRILESLIPLDSSDYSSIAETKGYNISNRLTFRHKFFKIGRTFSTDINTSFNEREPYSKSITSKADFTKNNTSIIDRVNSTMNSGFSVNTNIAYSEPIGKISQIQVNMANSYSKTYSYKKSSFLDSLDNYAKIDTLSNKYLNYFITNRLGVSYRLKSIKLSASAGFELQSSNLSGDQTYPKPANTNKWFPNILPNAQLNYRVTQQHNVIVNYNTSTNPPSISQLQNVAEYSASATRITMGNPNLEPQYQHNLTTRLTYVNREKGSNFFLLFGGAVSQNSIGNSTVYIGTTQIITPVNKGTGYNFRSMANYGFPIKLIKCNMNVSGGYNFTKTPGFVNGKENISTTNAITGSAVLSSNISEKLDFAMSTNGNYTFVDNTVNAQNNNNYYSQNSRFRLNWIFWKGFTLQNEVSNRLYRGMSASSFNQDITVVNMGLGKKFLKNQAGELRLSVYDLFNKNTTISRTITANQIVDQQSTALSRYIMASFTYTFRYFKSGSAPEKGERHRHDDFGERPDRGNLPPQGPPPGNF